MEVGLVAAFLGGALALLSPCGALLLPAFFATAVGSHGRRAVHAGVFFIGLSLTLVPLGLGAAALGSLMTEHRGVLIAVAGWVIVTFGLLTALGLGFDLQRVLPGTGAASRAAGRRSGLPRSLLMGTVSGVAGFCAGPILGAVLTMAAASSPVVAGVTLAVYGAGMVVPMLGLALAWERMGTRGRAVVRGREVRLGPVTTHTTSLVSGLLLLVVGVVFLRTNGMAALPELIPAAVLSDLQQGLIAVGAAVPDVLAIGALALVALAVWVRVRRSRARAERP